jgi:hypothetical protein
MDHESTVHASLTRSRSGNAERNVDKAAKRSYMLYKTKSREP